MRHCMAAVLYCNGTIICNFGEKSGSLLGKNPASMGGSLASTKKKPQERLPTPVHGQQPPRTQPPRTEDPAVDRAIQSQSHSARPPRTATVAIGETVSTGSQAMHASTPLMWQRIIIVLKLKNGLDLQKTITKVRRMRRFTDPTALR